MSQPTVDLARREHIRSIAKDIFFTILTLGFWNIYVQYRQILAMNQILGREKYRFWPWLLLSIITLGIYHVYHEYRMSSDLSLKLKETSSAETILAVTMAVLGLFPVTDAIQQSQINRYFGHDAL